MQNEMYHRSDTFDRWHNKMYQQSDTSHEAVRCKNCVDGFLYQYADTSYHRVDKMYHWVDTF